MKVTLYMAISIDGYIAKQDGDSDWVSPVDSENFEKSIEEAGCIVVGRKTFEQFYGELYPVEAVTNIVLSNNAIRNDKNENVVYVQSPKEALQVAESNGHSKVLLIGGGQTNGAFIKENLIDEVILSVHPLILGEGIKIFEDFSNQVDLDFVSAEEMEAGLLQVRYKIKK